MAALSLALCSTPPLWGCAVRTTVHTAALRTRERCGRPSPQQQFHWRGLVRVHARAFTGLLLRIYLPLHTALSLGTVIVAHPSSHSKDALHCSPVRACRRPQASRRGPAQAAPRSDNCDGLSCCASEKLPRTTFSLQSVHCALRVDHRVR